MKKIMLAFLSFWWVSLAHAVTLPGPIVTTEWLVQNKDQVQILDVRSNPKSLTQAPVANVNKKTGKTEIEEAGGYIPSSLFIDYSLVRSERMLDGQKTKYLIPEKAEMESRLREAGVRSDKPLVLVPIGMDPSDIAEALRLYWTLKVFGDDRVAVLDGGLAGWITKGQSVVTAPVQKPIAGNWSAKGYRDSLIAGSKEVDQASKTSSSQLIDGRDASSFFGITKRGFVNSYGHIAGAKMLAPETVFRPAQGALFFHTKSEYQTLARLAGIDAQRPTITYCNSGNLASIPWFVMAEMLGNNKTSLYDGSLYLWSREGRSLVGVLK